MTDYRTSPDHTSPRGRFRDETEHALDSNELGVTAGSRASRIQGGSSTADESAKGTPACAPADFRTVLDPINRRPVPDRDIMRIHKTVLTTGEVAKICNVAPRTVSKWFDAGHLRGYRIPGSKDRRIPIEHLLRFMRTHGIPLNGLDAGHTRILVFDPDPALCDAVQTALNGDKGFEVVTASTALEAGAAAQNLQPQVVIADVTLPDAPPQAITRFVRSLPTSQATCLIGIAPGLTEAKGQELLQQGFDGFLSKPFDVRSLRKLIEEKAPTNVPVDSA